MKISNFLHDLTLAISMFDMNYDCFSIGQLQSKEWAVEIIRDARMLKKINLGTIYVLCGWYGILPAMLFLSNFEIEKIRSFDIDEECKQIADRINRTYLQDEWKFQAVTKNILDMTFKGDTYKLYSYGKKQWFEVTEYVDTIINTSCEHTDPSWFNNIPDKTFVVLQTNDSPDEEGHINPVENMEEFKDMYPLTEVYYDGSMTFEKYKRFMLVGIK